ncbi:MAG: MFS transporter [Bacteroides sp.]|nr:MFS transporter [Bacteroides sp.]
MVKLQALNVPVRRWVPQWLGFVTAMIIMIPVALINGAYTGDITEVSGTLGVLSEDIRMAYYATSVGMAVAYPLIPKVRAVLTTKTALLIVLLMQAILSFICAKVHQIDIVIICSFFIGFFKGFAMLEIIIMIRPFFSPANVRSEFYAYFYPIVFSAGQVSMALTAQLAYYYQWQHMYYFVVILLLIAIVFISAFFRYGHSPLHIPFKEMDGRSVLLAATSLLFIIYIFTYGKTLDWFSSPKIVIYTVATPILLWLFFYRQSNAKKPYIRVEVLNHSKALIGYFFMILTMFFSSSSSLIISYATSIIRIDSVHTNALNLWMLPGFRLGAIICFWWFRWQRWRFRFLISGGMFCFVIYFAILYFGIAPGASYEMLYFPMFLRGMGMMVLFIAFGVYVVEDMNPRLMIYNAFFLIAFRSALAPALSTSFYNNILYRLQLNAMNILSENMTMDNLLASKQYTQSLNSALAQGHGMSEATQMATNSLYATLQTQSLLLGLKTVLGYMLIASLVIAIISRFIPFHKTVKVAIVKTGEDMV